MIPVLSAARVRELDRRLIEEVGLPGIALMELASRGVAEVVVEHFGAVARRGVVVVCGGGNNGGDGFGCARWLHGWGVPVSVWALDPSSRGDAAIERQACERLGVRFVDGLGDAGVIVDAMFGTGLDRPVAGARADAISAIAAHGAPVVAVDVPSGLDADRGRVLGVAVRATRTVTFGRRKLGMFGEPGADFWGAVHVVDIGLDAVARPDDVDAELPEPADLAPSWPRRARGDHKHRSGHVLLVAGSRNMAGAGVLAASGALAAGAGLVTLAVPHGAVERLAELPPEIMVADCGGGDVLEAVPEGLVAGKTAVGAGPGLGGGAPIDGSLAKSLRALWARSPLPIAFDADALPFSSGEGGDTGRGGRVITPHPGEAARLLGTSAASVQSDRFASVAALATGRVALLKGRYTLVAAPGERPSINSTNSPVLGTGGSGDVLLGVIAGLLGRGVAPRDAARLAAWVHGRAAERLESVRSQGWTAGDVAREIPEAVEELLALP